jgi:A/G-specific adenine glycosylase
VFPNTFEEILQLPGIGRYTAGAICSIAFNQPEPAVDGNVGRVFSRLFGIAQDLARTQTRAELERIARLMLEWAVDRHRGRGRSPVCGDLTQGLMELGALICTPRDPRCDRCPVQTHCVAWRENKVGQLPRPVRRRPSVPRWFAGFLLRRHGRFLVRRRPQSGINAGLWEFPTIELAGAGTDLAKASRQILGTSRRELVPAFTVRHTITHHRITLRFYWASPASKMPRLAKGRWCTLPELKELPFTGAHRKLLVRLVPERDRAARSLDISGG